RTRLARRRQRRRAGGRRGRSVRGSLEHGPRRLLGEVQLRRLQLRGLQDLDELVAEQLAALDEGVRDLLDRGLVLRDQRVRCDVGVAEQLRSERALVAVVEDSRERIVPQRTTVAGAVHDLRPDQLEALADLLAALVERLLRRPAVRAAVDLDLLGRHTAGPDHPGRPGGRALHVAAYSGRVLPVEDAPAGRRAEGPDQLRHLLGAPGAEALLLLACLVVAERRAAPLDREAGRFRALEVDVRGGRVAGLVDRDRPRLLGNVLGADRRSRLDGRHRLDDVLPGEGEAPVGGGDRQRHRADLPDQRRRIAVGDAGEFVAALLGVEVL